MRSTIRRISITAAACALAAVCTLIYSALAPSAAHAQRGALLPAVRQSIGPISLNSSESTLIGLLLPAVQDVARPAALDLFDSSGKLIVEIPVAMGDGSVRSAFYRASFTPNADSGRGFLTITDGAGKVLGVSQTTDGILIGLLLPAVQRGGNRVGALSSSAQVFDANGNRTQYVGFCDGSV